MGFRIFEPGFVGTTQVDLTGIHDVKHQHLMAPMPQKAESLERQRSIQQKIGDEDDETTAAELGYYPAESGLRGSSLPRLECVQDLQQLAPMTQASSGRSNRANIIIEGDQA